jgi:hypothetical protein
MYQDEERWLTSPKDIEPVDFGELPTKKGWQAKIIAKQHGRRPVRKKDRPLRLYLVIIVLLLVVAVTIIVLFTVTQ